MEKIQFYALRAVQRLDTDPSLFQPVPVCRQFPVPLGSPAAAQIKSYFITVHNAFQQGGTNFPESPFSSHRGSVPLEASQKWPVGFSATQSLFPITLRFAFRLRKGAYTAA